MLPKFDSKDKMEEVGASRSLEGTTEDCTSSVKSVMCVFCFKSLADKKRPRGRPSRQDDRAILRRFFTMVKRYFDEKTGWNGGTQFLSVLTELSVESCEDCFTIVDEYCETYHKMKCLELELDKILDKLKQIMKRAEENTLRVGDFISWTLKERGRMEKSMDFRQNFQKYCEMGRLEVFPKVAVGQRRKSRIANQTSNLEGAKKFQHATPSSTMHDEFDESVIMTMKVSPPTSPIHENFENDWPVDLLNFPDTNDNDVYDNDDYVACETISVVNNEDESSSSDGDELWYEARKKRRKTKQNTIRKRKNVSHDKGSKKTHECRKCSEPRPSFHSHNALHVHHNYLHTNGYARLTKSDISEVLHLKENNLRLKVVVPTPVFRCSEKFPECTKEFMLAEELHNHQKYHGNFSCESCGLSMDYAVDMVMHEIEHFKESGFQQVQENWGSSCGKCTYSTIVVEDIVDHYLEVHMKLPKIRAICPICQQEFKHIEKVPFLHYLNYHDLTRLEDDSSSGISCSHEGCSAYFLTEDQLQKHWNIAHGIQKPKIGVQGLPPEMKSQRASLKRKRKFLRFKAKECDKVCQYCCKGFRVEYELRSHIWTQHADIERGESCGSILLTDDGLTIDEFAKENKFICPICEKVLSSDVQLKSHKLHHGEFKCNFCDVVKQLATELAVHETVHKVGGNDDPNSTNTTIFCPRCSFTTKNRLDYIDHHLEVHLGLSSDRKRCPICKKPAPSMIKKGGGRVGKGLKSWIIRHYMELHDKSGMDFDSMPRCTVCTAYFRTPVQLHNHSREIHGNQAVRECWECGKIFKDGDKLRQHRLSYHKVKESLFQFVCNIPDCGRRFERQIELDYHESNGHNEGNNMYACEICGKFFVGMGQLSTHMKAHGKEEKVKEKRGRKKKSIVEAPMCEQCGKVFKNQMYLRAHIKRHKGSEAWKHECSYCGKKCPDKSKLDEHIRIHTKEKPCVCQFCGVAYTRKKNLRLHIKAKHQEDHQDTKVFTSIAI